MKKSHVKLLIILTLFLFFSCSSSSESKSENLLNESLNSYLYSYSLSCLENRNSHINSFMPLSLKSNLNRMIIKDGIFYSFFELIYPERINQLNTLNFYDLYNDNCDWVDFLIMEMEEQRIAEQLLEMENHLADIVNPVNENLAKTEAEENEATIKEYIKNEVMTGHKNLGYMEYGSEKFIPQKIGENYILINSSNDKVSRDFYDKLFRGYKTEIWNITSSNEELLSITETEFKEKSYIPCKKTITEKNIKTIEIFNDNGQLIDEKEYEIYNEKEYIKSSLTLKYNGDNKVKESNFIEYKYNDEKFTKLLYSFNKKYLYKYNKDDIPPDFDYYENDILKMRNKYFSDDTYTSRIYFDDGYSVTTYYQNNMPVKEVFSVKDVIERVNTYEQ